MTRNICSGLLISTLMLLQAGAIPLPGEDIDKLTEQSSLIVLGEVIRVERGVRNGTAQISGKLEKVRIDRGTLRVDDVLRGSGPSLLLIEFASPETYEGWRVPTEQNHGVFFLQTGKNGELRFTDPYFSYIEVPRGFRAHGDTPLDRVISLLSAMLSLPNNRSVNSNALAYLRSSKSKTANTALRDRLNTTADPELQIRIANGLLLQGDISALTFIKRAFLTGPRIPISRFQEEVLGNAMAYSLKDPAAISDLEELLSSSSVYIRRGAAGALRGARSSKALNGLARALDDTDFDVRYWAVVGLAEVTGQKDWRPNETLFKSEEARFLTHWKEWKRTNKL